MLPCCGCPHRLAAGARGLLAAFAAPAAAGAGSRAIRAGGPSRPSGQRGRGSSRVRSSSAGSSGGIGGGGGSSSGGGTHLGSSDGSPELSNAVPILLCRAVLLGPAVRFWHAMQQLYRRLQVIKQLAAAPWQLYDLIGADVVYGVLSASPPRVPLTIVDHHKYQQVSSIRSVMTS